MKNRLHKLFNYMIERTQEYFEDSEDYDNILKELKKYERNWDLTNDINNLKKIFNNLDDSFKKNIDHEENIIYRIVNIFYINFNNIFDSNYLIKLINLVLDKKFHQYYLNEEIINKLKNILILLPKIEINKEKSDEIIQYINEIYEKIDLKIIVKKQLDVIIESLSSDITEKAETYYKEAKNILDSEYYKKNKDQNQFKLKEAIEMMSNAIKVNDDSKYYSLRAILKLKCKIDDNYFNDSIEDINKAIELDPKNADAYFCKGEIKKHFKEYQEAILNYNKAIELDPKKAGYYYNVGYCKYELKQYKEAINNLDLAIELDSIKSYYYNNRCANKAALKQYKEAIDDLDIAIELDPHEVRYYYNRGKLKLQLNLKQEAAKDFIKANELDPNYKLPDWI